MKKRIMALIVLSTILAAAAAFAGRTKETHTVTDTAGRVVKIPWPPERIVTGPVVMPNLIFAVGGADAKVVGMHPMSKSAWQNSVLRIMAPDMEQAETGFIRGGFKMNIEPEDPL